MKKIRYFLIFLPLLSSCAVNISPIKHDRNYALESGKAFVVIGINPDRDLENLKISGPQNLEITSEYLTFGVKYFLLELEIGTYTIDTARRTNKQKSPFLAKILTSKLDNEQILSFTVSSGQINYTGDIGIYSLSIIQLGADILNCTRNANEFVEKSYPEIAKKYAIKYVGNYRSVFTC
jgi:hypothetical protein